jgi:hypothetical protein
MCKKGGGTQLLPGQDNLPAFSGYFLTSRYLSLKTAFRIAAYTQKKLEAGIYYC